ncbi:NAD(P)-binding domain-containing protein [Nocardia sp. NEAU-G5]|uniref:NAD(P)-binding domain-containing protein n=1 Tax=Nocardia albiluteola TaxID=2842303 RepID=A0ABS6BDI3_9NOCA|nr:NAD(P)-binding domain-containing protein [Nocardia albiluteola]MBU3067830.1 NAD(P)-binding domain-containing protein [Nocardia albiluteola]
MAKIGFLGAGRLARALGGRLEKAGHITAYADVDGGHEEAVAGADVVVLAVPFPNVAQALDDAPSLAGRVVWSCVNAMTADLSGLAVGFDTSGAEQIAALTPGARLVAAIPPFAAQIARPAFDFDEDLAPSAFVCGDDAEANHIVSRLLNDIGVQAVDAGPLIRARYVEPAMMLMVNLAYDRPVPRHLTLRLLERTGAPE